MHDLAAPIIQMKAIDGYKGGLTVILALTAFTTVSLYSVGSMNRISQIIKEETICSYGSVFGLCQFAPSVEDSKFTCLTYGFNHLRKIKF